MRCGLVSYLGLVQLAEPYRNRPSLASGGRADPARQIRPRQARATRSKETQMDRAKCEDAIAAKGRPFTGAEYLESLRDGREVYVYGERVKDVTTHPAFRNSARSIARLYDALHDPAKKDVLTVETDTGSAGFTHKFFRTPKSAEDLVGARDAIAEWARMTYGWMGRAP